MKKKIVLYNTEGIGTDVEERYLECHGLSEKYEIIRIDGECDDTFFEAAKDAEAVSIVYLDVTDEVFEQFPECKILTIMSIGVNNIDMKSATRHGICVGNVPDYCIEEVAVHTIALMLDCQRKITQLDRTVKNGQWDIYACGKMQRISGMTYGLAAFGNIPRKIVELMRPFGVNFIAYDPFVPNEVFEQMGVKKADTIEELLAHSDMVSIHTPLIPSTYHMIGKEQLAHAKEGQIFICTGRGGVVDEEALKEALECGRIRAAGIDVVEDETHAESVLKNFENVIMTPHAAYYSEGSIVEDREKSLMQILEVLEEERFPTYLCNKDVIGNARFQKGK